MDKKKKEDSLQKEREELKNRERKLDRSDGL